MPDDAGQQKTEQATQKRREETRNRGQVARSPELNSAFMLLVGFTVLMMFRHRMLAGLEGVTTTFFGNGLSLELSPSNTHMMVMGVIRSFFSIILPVFIIMIVAGILVNILQIGFLFTGEPLVPKLEKIDPFKGTARIFSRRSLESLVRDIIKVVVVGWVAYAALRDIFPVIMSMGNSTVGQIFAFTGSSIFSIAMKVLIAYIVIAVLDYGFQRWDYERSMMMTRQEVREELKQTEGDPLLRQRIRSMQREMSRRRMMEEVPKAEVVITNPVHIAVALAYDAGYVAPVVVAKGRNIIAQKIRERAEEAGVPIVVNPPLAQALDKAADIGDTIPADLYTAVAEVLAYVYQLKGKAV